MWSLGGEGDGYYDKGGDIEGDIQKGDIGVIVIHRMTGRRMRL